MTIVACTDFSDHARQAADVAAGLARSAGEKLILVHVFDELGDALALASHEDAIYEPIRQRLRMQADGLRERFEIDVEPVTEAGVPHRKILELAELFEARLVVAASLGRAQHWWSLGSVAERLAQTASMPVLVVREASRMLQWLRGDRTLRVMVGVDLGSASRAALEFAQELRQVRDTDVLLVQVAWPMGEYYRFGLAAPVPIDRLRPELESLLIRDLKAWAGELQGRGSTHCLAYPGLGRVDAHLVAAAHEQDVDVLVVGTGHRPLMARIWQESVSRGVLHHAPMAVVTVPGPARNQRRDDIVSMRRVLLPTDLSELGNRALPVGYGLVAPGGVVHLSHVCSKNCRQRRAVTSALRELVPKPASARGITTEIEVIEDESPSLGICRAANRLGVDLICMATHGRSGVHRALMGSQASQVLERAQQPVLLVSQRSLTHGAAPASQHGT